MNCEAFAVGTTFDVSARKGIRKRFFVEHVESAPARPGVLSLFYTNDKTHIVTTDGNLSGPQPIGTETRSMLLTTDYIGGLVSQLQSLNRRMNRVLKHVKQSTKYPTIFQPNEPILIHGYEGTGKSLILSCMASAGFRKVIRIDTKTLNAGTTAKNQAAIEAMFNDARASQPSLVLLDDLQRLVPPSDGLCTATISAELEKLGGSRVLVVAACRSTSDINSDLIGPNGLSDVLELPIPDLHARRQILNVLLPKELDPDRKIVEALCLRTHGFTGKDLSRLLKAAGRHATGRHEKEQEDWVNVHRNSFNHKGSLEKLLDGQAYSQAAGRVENEQNEVNGYANGDDRSIDLTLEDFEVAFDTVRPTALREIFCETPKIQWSDIGGSQAMKERFDEIIGWPLKYSEMMKLYRMDTTKGVILYGPPGCSKTLTAQAVANTYDLNFIAVKGAELLSMYVGESERAVREIFRKARAASPCIIFFDEIDSIASERESAGTKGLNVLTTLLNEMDGFESLKNVLVLAATNKPEILDPAIMRPGRFDAHVYLGPPDGPARKEIFAISTKDLPIEEDLDFDNLVKRTDGCTGAEIVQICGSAKREAMIRNIGKGGFRLGMADFDKALLRTEQLVTDEMLKGYTQFSKKKVSI